MIVSIAQPAYLPWLGYFERVLASDLHVVLDHVAIDASSKTKFANRNKVRTKDGWCWLTVPLRTKGLHGNVLLDEVEIADDPRWAAKHRQSLELNYARARFHAAHAPFFRDVYSRKWTKLAELVSETTDYLLGALAIATPLVRSSELALAGEKSELILEICREVGATRYISGPFGRDYLDLPAFAEASIEVVFHDYAHPTYEQAFPGFFPFMSAVDLIFNAGPESRRILRTTLSKESSS